jgi:hypothetical protein
VTNLGNVQDLLTQFGSAEAVAEFARTRPRAERIMLEQAAADLAHTLPSGPGPLASYYRRWSAFARDLIVWPEGKRLQDHQAEALDELCETGRLAVRGPHGVAKSSTASMALLAFCLTRDEAGVDWKAPVTASVWGQLTAYFWPEVHKWARMLDWDAIGRPAFNERTELLTLQLKLAHGLAFSASPSEASAIEGAHADSMLYIFDEAKAIPDETWDAAEGAFANAGPDTQAEAFALAISTPGPPQGRFYAIHARKPGTEDWAVKHITMETAIKSGRMSADWAAARGRLWGETSALFKNRVRGEFATSDTDGVIPLEWVEAAQARWTEQFGLDGTGFVMPDPEWLGVDCSGSGADRTVLVRRAGDIVSPLERPRKSALAETGDEEMATAGRVVGILQAHAQCRAIIDAGGLGSGVVGRVREQVDKAQCLAFIAGASTNRKDATGELGFVNVRSAAWWNLREMLDPEAGSTLMLPPDDELVGDLCAPRWREMSGGKIAVESKDELRKATRLGRSTDAGDAVVQVCWRPENLSALTAATDQMTQSVLSGAPGRAVAPR